MKHLQLIGLSLAAMCIFAAIAVTAASALENPEILPNPTAAAPLLVVSKGGVATLTSGAGVITCKDYTNKGEFTSTRLGKVTIDFLSCSTAGVPCNSVGDEKGTILVVNGDLHLVDVLLKGVLGLGVAIKPPELSLKCGTIGILVKGTVIGEIDNITSGASIPANRVLTLLFHATVPGGITQTIKLCDFDKAYCEGKTYELLAEFGTGFKEAAEETEDELSFSKTVSIDF